VLLAVEDAIKKVTQYIKTLKSIHNKKFDFKMNKYIFKNTNSANAALDNILLH